MNPFRQTKFPKPHWMFGVVGLALFCGLAFGWVRIAWAVWLKLHQ